MALVFKGRWYKYSLILVAVGVLLLIYAGISASTKTSYHSCFSDYSALHTCAKQNAARRAAPTVRTNYSILLALLVSSSAVLLSFRKPLNTDPYNTNQNNSARYTAITVSSIILLLTFLILIGIFIALAAI
jgi:DeoR/GlpR family transcriptional regulator of sugar metabolism